MALGMNDKEIVIRLDGWSMVGVWVFVFGGMVLFTATDSNADKEGLFVALLIASFGIASIGRRLTKGRDSSAGHS